jgi:hypothetical protein
MDQLLANITPTEEERESLALVCEHIRVMVNETDLVLRMLLLLRKIDADINPDVIPKIDKILSASNTVKCTLPTTVVELDAFFKQKNVELSTRRDDDARVNKNPNAFNIETGKSVRVRSDNCARMKNVHHNGKQYTFYVPLSLMDSYVRFERLLLLVGRDSELPVKKKVQTVRLDSNESGGSGPEDDVSDVGGDDVGGGGDSGGSLSNSSDANDDDD